MIATDIKMTKLHMHIFTGNAIEPMRLQDRGKTTNKTKLRFKIHLVSS